MSAKFYRRLIYLAAQALHLLVLIFFVSESKGLTIVVSGITNVVLYSWLFKCELPDSRLVLPTPLLIYVLVGVIIQGFAPIWAGAAILGGYSHPFWHGSFSVVDDLHMGHLVLGVGDWMLIAGYTLVDRLYPDKRKTDSVSIKDVRRTAIALIHIGWAAELLDHVGFNFGNYISALKMLNHFAVPAGLLMLLFTVKFTSGADRRANLSLVVLVVAVQLPIALTSNMKQQAIVAIYPVVIYLLGQLTWALSRGRSPWLLLLGGFFVVWGVLFMLFPFSQLRRNDLWVDRQRLENVPSALPYLGKALEASTPFSKEFKELHVFPESGFWKFFKRHSYLKGAAWSYTYATRNGDQNGEFIMDGFIAVVPRLVWPEKPNISPGRKIAVLLGQADTFEDATTATDPGAMAGGLFLNGKWPCVIVVMFVNGILLQMIWKRIRRASLLNPVAAMGMILIYVSTGRFFGSSSDGNVSMYITIAIVYFPLIWIYNTVFLNSPGERSTRLMKRRAFGKGATRQMGRYYE